jgi:hypothetical protein
LIINCNGSWTITYTANGLNQNLAPGQTHTFSFDLDGESTTTDTLLAHYDELLNNPTTGVITVNAANLRNPIKPSLTVSVTPASMTESVTLSNPGSPQTVRFSNLSNAQLQITEIDTTNLPTGVNISTIGTTCSTTTGDYIEPASDEGDYCTIALDVDIEAVPEDSKYLKVSYTDPQNNSFEDQTTVTIGGAEISVDLTSIELPSSGDETTNVVITNDGSLNWTPSDIAANYQISVFGQSVGADNIAVVPATVGTNCLNGAAVSPAGTCNIGIEVNGDTEGASYTEPGNYVLSLFPANNLTTTSTTNFEITEPTQGAFAFLNDQGDDILTQNFEIGGGSVSFAVTNVGAIAITNFNLSIPPKFNEDPNTCDGNITLDPAEICTVTLDVANDAGTGSNEDNPNSFSIVATGDEATVSNNGQTLTATVQGAVISIESVVIPKPNDAATITEVTITNNGTNTIAWTPSNDPGRYSITGDDTTGLSIVDPITANPYCLDGIEVDVDASCTIGIQVANDAAEGDYSLTLALAENLAAAQSQLINVTGALGYFSFSHNDTIVQNITMGIDSSTQLQTITLSNTGGTDITNVYLDYLNLPGMLSVENNTCGSEGVGNTITLASGDECTFQVAADNQTTQGESYTITAIGDAATVENDDDAEFNVNVNGVVVQIDSINGGQAINRPAADNLVTDVVITNLGNIAWTPSDSDYEITRADEVAISNISIVAPSDGTNCLLGAEVGVGAACEIGIQTNSNTPKTNYTLQALAATTGDENLPQSSSTAGFSVTDSLGYFVYKNSDGDDISDTGVTLTIGGDAETITLENAGETEITAIGLVLGGDNPSKFTITNSATCVDQSLEEDSTCTFDIELDGAADGNTAAITTTGTNASNSPTELSVTAEEESSCTTEEGSVCRVFVTETDYNGNLGGLDGANAICAGDGNNPNNGSDFRAWLSDGDTNAIDNISYNTETTYKKLDGSVIANPGNLLGETPSLENAIGGAGVSAWTGTNKYGELRASYLSCNNWTGETVQAGGKGDTAALNATWTESDTDNCDAEYYLMCFEVPQ